MRRKNNYEPNFRAMVAIEAIKGTKTISQLASEHKVHQNLITKWKKEAISKLATIFQKQTNKDIEKIQGVMDELYQTIGKLKVENDFLKKKLMN